LRPKLLARKKEKLVVEWGTGKEINKEGRHVLEGEKEGERSPVFAIVHGQAVLVEKERDAPRLSSPGWAPAANYSWEKRS